MESATLMKRATSGVALILLLVASPALATPVPLQHGSVSYVGTTSTDGAHHMQGSIEYWVYSPNTFPYAPSDGYTPTTGEYVYVYQIHEDLVGTGPPPTITGVSPVSQLSVSLSTPWADNLGQFTNAVIGGPGLYAADLSNFNSFLDPSDSANWYFSTVIPAGGSSYGLAFSSPYSPILGSFGMNDDGTSAGTDPLTNLPLLPVPGNTNVPEPGTVLLLLLGSVCMVPAAVRRWRKS